MGKVDKAIAWMKDLANNPVHGYDQRYRWGEKGDYDCSSAIITAYQTAGIPVKTNGASYTGNMYHAFLVSGFKDVTSKVNLKTGAGMVAGDVLLNTAHHTAMYIGNGKVAQASQNEKGGAVGGVPGDQTGRETNIVNYYNFPWNFVLRYEEPKQTIKAVKDGVYRLYNQYTGDHLFTLSLTEAKNAVNNGWTYEDVVWLNGTGKPVYRLYNKYSGEHLFTADAKEKNNLVKAGWRDEGTAFKAGTEIPVYRLYNGKTHMLTATLAEKNNLLKSGYKEEGVGFYVKKK